MKIDVAMAEAISSAHRSANCGDYYCGCWDGWLGDEEFNARYDIAMWRHTSKFLEALRGLGYEVTPVRPTTGAEGPVEPVP